MLVVLPGMLLFLKQEQYVSYVQERGLKLRLIFHKWYYLQLTLIIGIARWITILGLPKIQKSMDKYTGIFVNSTTFFDKGTYMQIF